MTEPTAELDTRFSDPDAPPTPWSGARALLESAKVYWLSTVRPGGRPHVTPIAAVWVDGALHFTTGRTERKAKNLERNTQVVITTGSNLLQGLDVVVEGEAVSVTDKERLQRLADAYVSKYDDLFVFRVRDGALWIEGSEGTGPGVRTQADEGVRFRQGALQPDALALLVSELGVEWPTG